MLLGGVIPAHALPCTGSMVAPQWCKEPRIGEAKSLGPGCNLDDPEPEEPDDSDLDEWQPLPGDMEWLPDLLDAEFMDDEPKDLASAETEEQPASPPPVVDAWLRKHRGKSFVAVNGPVSSKPKFQGERPGWVFKLGAEGQRPGKPNPVKPVCMQ